MPKNLASADGKSNAVQNNRRRVCNALTEKNFAANCMTMAGRKIIVAISRFRHFFVGLLVIFPLVAQAQLTYITNNDAITITGYAGFLDGSFEVPDTINGLPVKSIGNNAFYNQAFVTNITISANVTNIGNDAFAFCASLQNLAIPDAVITVGDGAFWACGRATNLVIGTGVVSIGNNSFGSCQQLTSITIPDSTTSVGDNAFNACFHLTNIVIGSGVTSLGTSVFSYCTNLTGITVSSFNPAYSSVDGVLFDKDQKTLIQFPSGRGGNYSIPDGVTGLPTESFFGCAQLSSLTIPDSITSLGFDVVVSCPALTNVTIGNGTTNIDSFFFDCSSLITVTINTNNPNYSSLDGVLFDKSQNTLFMYPEGRAGEYIIPDGTKCIYTEAFGECQNLTGITIPDTVTNIGIAAVYSCFSLTNISVNASNPDFCSVGGVVFDKSLSTLVVFPPGVSGNYAVPGGVTGIGDYAFDTCLLTNVILPDSLACIGNGAFFQSGGPGFPGDTTNGLMSITIPASVINIGAEAFGACPSLESITVDPRDPFYSSVEGVLFNKDHTTLIQFPGGRGGSYVIPYGVQNIGEWAFEDSPVTNFTIPDTVAVIGDDSFFNCYWLTSVTIPASVASIGYDPFDACFYLTSVAFLGNAPALSFNELGYNISATVYYLSGTLGWDSTYGGLPTAPLFLPYPVILNPPGAITGTNAFGFIISWATNTSVVVEACTNLANPDWQPVQTNDLAGGSSDFNDAGWTNYPDRYYRLRSL